ncbi:MAG: cytochrome c maturation protein CcmE [Deltaproteobacteria bacterium]|nr:cytochrome c maturation protein CcmE [Deltaproteobacteria bacterium]
MMGLISALVVAGGIGYLVVSSIGDGSALEYFKDVHEAVDGSTKWVGRKLRMRGNVIAGTIQKKKGSLDYRFALYTKNRWVEVKYRGLVPDAFKDCAEVVVKGELTAPDRFNAHTITAKCPSKYEEKTRLKGCGTQLKTAVLTARSKSKTSVN